MIRISSTNIDKNKVTFIKSIPSKDQAHLTYYIFKIMRENPNEKNPDILFDKLVKQYVKPVYNMTDVIVDFCREGVKQCPIL